MENVTDQPPEGEPDNVTPCRATFPKSVDAVACGACNGSGTTGSLDTDVFECTACDGSGLSAQHRAEQLGSSYSGAVLDAIRDTLADVRHFDDDRRAPACPHGYDAEDACEGCTPPSAAEPERRTVTLEVLTDEVRAAAEAGQAGVGELFGGKVGIVLRLNGAVVDVPELDTLWQAPYRKPADVLAVLLRQARMYADGLHGNTGAELLMPTPDVLAALDGRPDATFWTEPIELRVERVKVGWIAVDFASVGSEDVITAVDGDCADTTCPWHGDCTAITASREPVHFADWQGVTVRIPAGPVTR